MILLFLFPTIVNIFSGGADRDYNRLFDWEARMLTIKIHGGVVR